MQAPPSPLLVLPPDAFALLANAVWSYHGRRKVVELLFAMLCDRSLRKRAENYCVRIFKGYGWKWVELDWWTHTAELLRIMCKQTTNMCWMCGKVQRRGIKPIAGSSLAGVPPGIEACSDCWCARYNLSPPPVHSNSCIAESLGTGPTSPEARARAGCDACLADQSGVPRLMRPDERASLRRAFDLFYDFLDAPNQDVPPRIVVLCAWESKDQKSERAVLAAAVSALNSRARDHPLYWPFCAPLVRALESRLEGFDANWTLEEFLLRELNEGGASS